MPKKKAVVNEQLATDIVTKYLHSRTWRNPMKQRWDRLYAIYRTSLEETAYPWQSNIFVPYSFSTIETVAPRMLNAKPQIDTMPRQPDDVPYAKTMNNLLDFEWEMMGMDEVLADAVKEMLIYGTTIFKVFWLNEDTTKTKRVNVDDAFPDLGLVEDEVTENVYDAPVVENIDLYDFFWDTRAIDIEDARWCVHRMYRTYEHLEEQQKQGIYKNVKLLEDMKTELIDDEKANRRRTMGLSMPVDIEESEGKQMVELLEYWEDDRVVTVANREIVIRDEKNPYRHGRKPFVKMVDQNVPHEFAGIGELEPIETLQYELNSRRNQRLDNVTLALNRMWIISTSAGVDEDELVSDAGGVIHTTDINGIKEIHMPDVTASSYKEEVEVKADIQQATGVSDFTRGVGSESLGNDTATGISLIQEAGNSRFKLKIRNMEQALKKIGRFMVDLNEQFMSEEKIIRVMGDEGAEFLTIRPEDMQGNLDVRVEAGSSMPSNEAVRRKQVMDSYQLFAQDPEINQTELKRMVLEVVLPEANIDKLLPRPSEATDLGQQPTTEQQSVSPPSVDTGGQLDQQGILESALAPEQVL